MREDDCVMLQRPASSTSHAAPPAFDAAVAHPEQGPRRADPPPTHFNEAQAEQALWQEFHDHNVSINSVLIEVLRIHGGPSIQLFEVSALCQILGLLLTFFCFFESNCGAKPPSNLIY
jgi:hypothetical protein